MGGPEFNARSSLNLSAGAFRSILFEAEKVKLSEKIATHNHTGGSAPAEGGGQVNAPVPGADDPLKPDKIEVKVDGGNTIESIFNDPNIERAGKLLKALGFKDIGDFMDRIAGGLAKEGVKLNRSVPIFSIALSLLSTDAVRALEKPPSTQEGASFDDFIVVEKSTMTNDDEKIAVTTGTEHILKLNADGEKLVEVGVALARLVNAGRLDEDKIYAYANHRVCDVREKDDMVGVARTCIAGIRGKIEDNAMLRYARQTVENLRKGGSHACPEHLAKAVKIDKAINRYLAELDKVFPRDIVATRHTRGLAWNVGKELENGKVWLEAQANLLTDWLRETFDKPPDPFVFHNAALGLKNDLIEILDLSKEEIDKLPKSSRNSDEGKKVGEFIEKDLRHQVAVLRNEVKFAQTIAEDAEVRHAQEMALSQCAKNRDGRILPSKYTIDLGASGGVLFGVSTNASVKLGGGFSYKMTIDVNHVGKVTVLSVKGPRGEIGIGANVGTAEVKGKLSGGRMSGTELVYDNIDEFLKNSSTDLRIRLHAGGLFHFGWDKNVLARKVDNTTFKAMLKESDYLREGDKFITQSKSKLVMDKNEVVRKDVSGMFKMGGGQHIANARADLKIISVSRKHVTYTSRFMDVTKPEQLGSGFDIVRNVTEGSDGTLKGDLAALNAEMDDFEQAVNYHDWEKSSKLRKFMNRHTASIRPPRIPLEEYLAKRVPGYKPGDKIDSDLKARYLASISATAAYLGIRAHGGGELPDEAAKSAFAGEIREFQNRTHQPQCHVSQKACAKHLYTSQKTDLGRTLEVDGSVSASANLHLPVVNVLGADLLGGFAPGVKVACKYQHRMDADKTGIPHLDADRLEITIGTKGIKAERVITATLKAIMKKLGGKAAAKSVATTFATTYLASPAISVGLNVLTGSTGDKATGENRFKDTHGEVFGALQYNFSTGGDSGVGVRFQLVKTEDGGWKMESVQAVDYSETTVEASGSVMVAPGFGIYAGASGGYGSTSVLGERFYGNSLMPLMRGASEFKLDSMTMQRTVAWNAFLANNEKGLAEIAANIREGNNLVSKELERYVDLAKGLSSGGSSLADRIREDAGRLSAAATPKERVLAATALFTTLTRVTAAHLKEHPLESNVGKGRLAAPDLQAVEMEQLLDGELDVELEAEDGGGAPDPQNAGSSEANGFIQV